MAFGKGGNGDSGRLSLRLGGDNDGSYLRVFVSFFFAVEGGRMMCCKERSSLSKEVCKR